MVLFHLFFLLGTTIRPKIRVVIYLFFLFACDHLTKIYDPLSFILSLCTTIQPKIRVVIYLFVLFAHDQSTKIHDRLSFILSFVHDIGVTLTIEFILSLIVPIFCLLNLWQYCPYISYTLFLAVLPLYFIRYIHSSTTHVFCTLYTWKPCSYISYAIFMAT